MLLFSYIDTIKNLLAENRNLFLDKNLFNIAGSVALLGLHIDLAVPVCSVEETF